MIRKTKAALLLFTLTLLAGCDSRPPAVKAAEIIAGKYGYKEFDKVEMVRYTFNVLSKGDTISRYWTWNPNENWFEYYVPNATDKARDFHLKIYRDSMNSNVDSMTMKADQRFINDNYWLLFPLHLLQDENMNLNLSEEVEMPIGKGKANRLTVSYGNNAGGYTPGDAYELYFDNDYIVQQWSFLRGGVAKYAFPATWENNQRAGPLLFSLDRKNPEDGFHLWFTDVAVKMKGSEKWIAAE